MRSPGVIRMKYRRIRPAAYAISLCSFSNWTSNIAFGSAWVTTASRTTASSFWTSPSVLRVRDRDCRRGPRRGVELLANSVRSLATPYANVPLVSGRTAPSAAEVEHPGQSPRRARWDGREQQGRHPDQHGRPVGEVAVADH